MCTIDNARVETFLSVHKSAHRIYVVTKLPEAISRHDLYYLIHIRAHFTDAEIGDIAF